MPNFLPGSLKEPQTYFGITKYFSLYIQYIHTHKDTQTQHTHSSLVNIACVRQFNPLKAECL